MRTVIYPGSFDPFTYGHLDVVERAAKLFDRVIVAVAKNPDKQTLFTQVERKHQITKVLEDLPNVEITTFEGLLVDFAREQRAQAIIRGLRAVSDFEFEFQMATMNYHLNSEVSTLLMVTKENFIHLNSSMVKDIAKHKGDISSFVPLNVLEKLNEKFHHN